MVDRRRQAAIAVPHHPVPGPQGEGPAGAYAGARPLRDEGQDADARNARLGSLGSRDPELAAAASEQHRQHDASHCPRRRRPETGACRMSVAAVAHAPPESAAETLPRSEAFVELEKVTHTYGRGERQVHALVETNL